MRARFFGVGVGPGDPELMTLRAVRVIQECPVIAVPQTASGASLAYDIVSGAVDLSEKQTIALRFSMSREDKVLEQSHSKAAQQIIEKLEQGLDVAMPNLGDVSIYATFNYLKPLVEKAGFEVQAIPGIPSFCAIAARLKANLTPDMNTPLHVVPAASEDLGEVLSLPGTKVIMKAGKPLSAVKQALREADLYEKASLVQNCCLPNEKVAQSLDEAEENAGYFTTLVVRP